MPDQDEWLVQEATDAEPRRVTVLDFLNPAAPRASAEERAERLATCQSCDNLKPGTICGLCHCFLRAKTWLAEASCDAGKWGPVAP